MLRTCRWALEANKKLSPQYLVNSLKQRGTTAFFGMPDYHLQPLTSYLADHTAVGEYVMATNSGNAMAMAAGHYLSTLRTPCVFMQNTGIGGAMSPLLTLFHEEAYRMPCLMLISWRGRPDTVDERMKPGLVAQGRLTEHCLTAVGIPYSIIGDSLDIEMNWDVTVDKAYYQMNSEKTPFAVLLEPDTFERYTQRRPDADPLPVPPLDHEKATEQICRQFGATEAFVCSAGSVQDSLRRARTALSPTTKAQLDVAAQDMMLADSFGNAAGVATGIALSRPSQQVICIEGDGSTLAHLSTLATNGGLNATKDIATGAGLLRNLKHIVINDGSYSQEGGQATAAFDASLTGVAKACGYFAIRDEPVVDIGDLVAALGELRQCEGPAFLEVVVAKPTKAATPGIKEPRDLHVEKRRFVEFLNCTKAQ